MTTTDLWARRVAEWRASGLSSEEFASGRDFTAGGLRSAAHALRKAGTSAGARLARVVPTREVGPSEAFGESSEGEITIEIGHARVTVRKGFDASVLATVLAVLGGTGR